MDSQIFDPEEEAEKAAAQAAAADDADAADAAEEKTKEDDQLAADQRAAELRRKNKAKESRPVFFRPLVSIRKATDVSALDAATSPMSTTQAGGMLNLLFIRTTHTLRTDLHEARYH